MIAKSMLDCKLILNFNDLAKEYVEKYNIKGKMLQVGGANEDFKKTLEFYGFKKGDNLDIVDDKKGYTIVGDICSCPEIKDSSYDFIFSIDAFEHIERPWDAAKEIVRLLKPNGLVVIVTLFSWRYHEVPIDYWRYTPQCLNYLFKDLTLLEANWDCRNRRQFYQGDGTANDRVPTDEFEIPLIIGGKEGVRAYYFIENWRVYYVGIKKEKV